MKNPVARLLLLALLLSPLPQASANAPDEIRAVWAQAWVNTLHSPQGIDNLIADAKAANINTLIVQMRRRGDTLYFSDIEPRASGVQSGFDALAYILEKAHEQNPPMEVHAWIVVYPIDDSTNPEHIRNKKPEWLTQTASGNQGAPKYQHDPGHPGVHQYLLDVSMELITKYDIDGLHYDYIRYNGNQWGYNPVAVERFQRLYNRTDVPSNTDAEWSDFRRNQITQTVRRIYLYAMEARPEVKISASTITWSPGPANTSDFSSTRPYYDILSNWPAWMEEGTLDLNVPMSYFRKHNTQQNIDYSRWDKFIKDTRFNRHAAIGPGIYLNTIPNSLSQIRETREPTAQSSGADGVALYAYHATNMDWDHPDPQQRVANHLFYDALINPSEYDPITPPVFAEPAAIPEMPWKTNPTTGHLKGYVRDAESEEVLDGAWVHLIGAVERTIQTDPTGFYGFVDLPPGDYLVSASWDGEDSGASSVAVSVGNVATRDLDFGGLPAPTVGQLQGYVRNAPNDQPVGGATVHLSGPEPREAQTSAQGFYRFLNLPPGDYTATASWSSSPEDAPATMISASPGIITHQDLHFSVGGGTPGEQVILDNIDVGVSFIGPEWETGANAGGHGSNYRFARNPGHAQYAGLHTAIYAPSLPKAGIYKIDTWYLQGSNRGTNVPYTVSDGQNDAVVIVNQQIDGSQWFNVIEEIHLDPADDPFVKLENTGSHSVTIADAIRWTLLEPVAPEFSIATQIEGEGRIDGVPSNGLAPHGSVLQLEAVGENGHTFSHWNGKNAWGSENPLALEVGADLEIGAVFVSAWLNWIEENFTEGERAALEFIAPDADPFGQGVSNLLKFALGLDLRQPDRTLLPAASADNDGVVLTFRRLQGDFALAYLVEFSADLAAWDSDSERIEEISADPNGDGTETVTVRIAAEGEGRLFVRLRVEQN